MSWIIEALLIETPSHVLIKAVVAQAGVTDLCVQQYSTTQSWVLLKWRGDKGDKQWKLDRLSNTGFQNVIRSYRENHNIREYC